jgi:hypothetical protein
MVQVSCSKQCRWMLSGRRASLFIGSVRLHEILSINPPKVPAASTPDKRPSEKWPQLHLHLVASNSRPTHLNEGYPSRACSDSENFFRIPDARQISIQKPKLNDPPRVSVLSCALPRSHGKSSLRSSCGLGFVSVTGEKWAGRRAIPSLVSTARSSTDLCPGHLAP